jgi:hypothetical protein
VTVTPHLYSIDSAGEISPAGPGDNDAGGSGSENGGRRPNKARPKFPVPTDRLRFDKQVEALRVISTASRNGQETVDARKMASLMGLAEATVPLNNAFFASVDLIKKVGKGDYLPTETAMAFQRKWTFDKEGASKLLAPAFVDSWFFEAVKQKTAIGPTTREDMVETLAILAETDSTYSTQCGMLLDWLEYVGLISMEGGVVAVVGDSAVADETPETPAPIIETPAPAPTAASVPVVGLPHRGPAVVALSIDLHVTADDLARLSPEQISALFDGVGKVAAIQAVLTQQG